VLNPNEHVVQTHLHLLENIKLADQKATAFVAINSGIIAAIYAGKLLVFDGNKPYLTGLCIATLALLGLGLLLAGLVIWPRGERMARLFAGGQLAIPTKISGQFKTTEAYRDAVAAAGQQELIENWCALIVTRSQVNDIKYGYLKWSILVSALGLAVSVAFVVHHTLQ
jgi:hypothetical protein